MKKLIFILLIAALGFGCKKEESTARILTVQYSGFTGGAGHVVVITNQRNKTLLSTMREFDNKNVDISVTKGDVISVSMSFFGVGKIDILVNGKTVGGGTNGGGDARYDKQPFTVY